MSQSPACARPHLARDPVPCIGVVVMVGHVCRSTPRHCDHCSSFQFHGFPFELMPLALIALLTSVSRHQPACFEMKRLCGLLPLLMCAIQSCHARAPRAPVPLCALPGSSHVGDLRLVADGWLLLVLILMPGFLSRPCSSSSPLLFQGFPSVFSELIHNAVPSTPAGLWPPHSHSQCFAHKDVHSRSLSPSFSRGDSVSPSRMNAPLPRDVQVHKLALDVLHGG